MVTGAGTGRSSCWVTATGGDIVTSRDKDLLRYCLMDNDYGGGVAGSGVVFFTKARSLNGSLAVARLIYDLCSASIACKEAAIIAGTRGSMVLVAK